MITIYIEIEDLPTKSAPSVQLVFCRLSMPQRLNCCQGMVEPCPISAQAVSETWPHVPTAESLSL